MLEGMTHHRREGGEVFLFSPPIFPETKHLPPSLKDDMLSRAIATDGKSADCIKLMNSINFQRFGRPSVREPLVEMQLNWLLTSTADVFLLCGAGKRKKMVMVVITTHLFYIITHAGVVFSTQHVCLEAV